MNKISWHEFTFEGNTYAVEETDWARSRPWAECIRCHLKWKSSDAKEQSQRHTAETGHATLYCIESSRVTTKERS